MVLHLKFGLKYSTTSFLKGNSPCIRRREIDTLWCLETGDVRWKLENHYKSIKKTIVFQMEKFNFKLLIECFLIKAYKISSLSMHTNNNMTIAASFLWTCNE